MEELQKRHHQEQKELQSRITQKKKSATKKSRKGVNDECEDLERQLKEKQSQEISKKMGGTEADEPAYAREDAEVPGPKQVQEDISQPMFSMSINSTAASNGQVKKPNRQKARLARRAAEQEAAAEEAENEAANLPNLREKESKSMCKAYTLRGLTEHEIRSDGHCLYAAIADQLINHGVGLKAPLDIEPREDAKSSSSDYQTTREVAAAYITQNSDDFSPFLEEPLESYVKTIRETGEWGGHLEILALAKAYGVDINVLQADGKVAKIECGSKSSTVALWLAYYHHNYGLGEHYNSLRQATG